MAGETQRRPDLSIRRACAKPRRTSQWPCRKQRIPGSYSQSIAPFGAFKGRLRRECIRFSPREPFSPRFSKFEYRGVLLQSCASDFDPRDGVVFAANGGSGESAKHRDLSNVRKRISDGALKNFLSGSAECCRRSELLVQRRKRGEKSLDVIWPRLRFRAAPLFLTARERQSPIHQVAQVRQDFSRRPRALGRAKAAEIRRRVAHRLGRAIRERRERMAQRN